MALSVSYEINDPKIQKSRPRGAPHTYTPISLSTSISISLPRLSLSARPFGLAAPILIDRSRFVSAKLILNAPRLDDAADRYLAALKSFSPGRDGCSEST